MTDQYNMTDEVIMLLSTQHDRIRDTINIYTTWQIIIILSCLTILDSSRPIHLCLFKSVLKPYQIQ